MNDTNLYAISYYIFSDFETVKSSERPEVHGVYTSNERVFDELEKLQDKHAKMLEDAGISDIHNSFGLIVSDEVTIEYSVSNVKLYQ